jgi:hypothetical protein
MYWNIIKMQGTMKVKFMFARTEVSAALLLMILAFWEITLHSR